MTDQSSRAPPQNSPFRHTASPASCYPPVRYDYSLNHLASHCKFLLYVPHTGLTQTLLTVIEQR